MDYARVNELLVDLQDIDAGSSDAILSDSTVTIQNWDEAMLLGCCSQGCC